MIFKPLGIEIELPDDWKDQMLIMASEGKNWIVWVNTFAMLKDHHYLLMKEVPEYKEHVDACLVSHEAYWNELLRENIGNRSFNHSAWVQYMKENCGYGKGDTDPKNRKPSDKTDEQEVLDKYKIRAVK